ncbi:conserved phage C-terminal domain-containing protein [Senegalimassilia anaerobia]
MARSFTWFEKFGEVMEALPDENQAEFALAIVRYGSLGEEPEFDSPLMAALFTAIREDVDNSLTKRASASKGGRPPKAEKQQAKTNGGGNAETGSAKPKTKAKPKPETGSEVSETKDKPVSETGFEKPETSAYINQSNTVQANPVQTRENQARENQDAFFPEDDPEANAFAEFAAGCIDAFNAETGSDYRWGGGGRLALDLRRMFDAGRTVDDARAVVRRKRDEWRGSKRMAQHIRPETLFGEKFESYLNEKGADHADAGVYASAF